mmetsp:Transcript_27411/g.78881  ORF Transcript_27411/g.78881 Transcript_27411/m.78881 type:complete len:128 (+) Transcript_27411:452-835(+)
MGGLGGRAAGVVDRTTVRSRLFFTQPPTYRDSQGVSQSGKGRDDRQMDETRHDTTRRATQLFTVRPSVHTYLSIVCAYASSCHAPGVAWVDTHIPFIHFTQTDSLIYSILFFFYHSVFRSFGWLLCT